MTPDRRTLILLHLAAFAVFILAACAAVAVGEAEGRATVVAELDPAPIVHDDVGNETPPPDPDLPANMARWWRSGVLAGPLALGLYGLLALGSLLSRTRWPRLAFLRRGRVQSTISIAGGLLLASAVPLAVTGTLTMPGLFVAISTLGFSLPPGGGERAGEVPT